MQAIKFNNEIEYTSNKFNQFCVSVGIEQQLIASYTPQQYGVIERKSRTIMKITKCLLHDKELLEKLWANVTNKIVFFTKNIVNKSFVKKDSI